ncbi:MAG: FecR domain-containing protein [Chloroflexi bacterium]|nr:FecR domain-containing protein [Chloroflexota bacterium]
MRSAHPDRVAWLVLWGAFAVFLLLCALVPYGGYYYLLHATSPRTANLEVISGTVRVRQPGSAAPLAVTRAQELDEGSTVETDENSRCILTLLDGSTVTLFPGTQLTLREMRVPAFAWGIEPIHLAIDQTRGRVRVGAAHPLLPGEIESRERDFRVFTPQMQAVLIEGSYAVEVTAEGAQVTVSVGSATVFAQERTVTVNRGQRTVARNGEPPLAAMPAAQDIIVNGDFKDPLARGWSVVREAGGDPATAAGAVSIAQVAERFAIRISRTNSNQTSAITGVVQQINREVSDYRTMRIAVDVRLRYQSLSGGGILSSEYPVIVRLRYRDVYGSEAEWVHGFYYQNTANNPTLNGEQVPADVWVPFESKNLFESLEPRPFFITTMQIYASGWDYDSYVSGVRLIVE